MKRRILLILFAALLLVLALGACAENHVFGDWIDDTPATCTTPGVKGHYHCDHCGKNFTVEKVQISDEDLVIPATDHTWDDGMITTPATCTTDGIKTYTCTKCDKTQTEVVPAGHTFGEWIPGTEATASTPGEKGHYHCSVCEKDFDEDKQTVLIGVVILPLGHTYGEKNDEIPATCTTTGMQAHYICTCHSMYFNENGEAVEREDLILPVIDHEPTRVDETAKTCFTNGIKEHFACTVCGQLFDMEMQPTTAEALVIPASHNYGEEIAATQADCIHAATVAHYTCSVCGQYFDINKNKLTTIDDAEHPATGIHTPGEWITDQDSTCIATGTKHQVCTVCGEIFNAGTVVEMKEHQYGEEIAATQADCIHAATVAHYTCSVCGQYFYINKNKLTAILDAEHPATGIHTPGEWIVDQDSTCIATGTKHQVCTVCGETINAGTVIQMKEHQYGNIIAATEANCGYAATVAHYECKNCHQCFDEEKNLLKTIDIAEQPATGAHNYGEWIPAKQATSEEDGHVGHYHCDGCGKNFDENHKEIDNITTTVWSPLV